MKNRKTRKKNIVLAMAMAVGMLLPMTVNAQDFFFRGGNDDYENRDGSESVSITTNTQNFGESAPVGTGLLIMTVLGTGYAFLKKQED